MVEGLPNLLLTFMGKIERGESNMSFQNIHKVAAALGVTLSSLFRYIQRTIEKDEIQFVSLQAAKAQFNATN
jgi:transcriptional regulator with XRE-family HTH domain